MTTKQALSACVAMLGPIVVPGAPAIEKQSFALPAPGRAVTIAGQLKRSGASWRIMLEDAKAPSSATLTLSATDPLEGAMDVRWIVSGQKPFVQRYFVRPDLKFYVDESRRGRFMFSLADKTAFDERRQVMDKYHLFRSVLDHRFTIRIERTPKGIETWLDGRFIGAIINSEALTGGVIAWDAAGGGPEIVECPALWVGSCLTVDLNAYARPGKLLLDSGLPHVPAAVVGDVAGVPMRVDAVHGNVDVGISRWLEEKIDPADFCDTDTTRSAFDGNPESIIVRLPKENFMTAHLLCVVEPDPAKVPAMTLRLTRFGNHYGDSGGRSDQAVGDTEIRFPAAPSADGWPAGMRVFGEVDAGLSGHNRWGKATEEKVRLPVYLVSVPLKTGQVADLLGEDAPGFGRRNDHWDLELTREIRTAVHFFNLQSCRVKPLGLPSAVHVIGLTLERSPIDVTVSSRVKGNVFYAAEQPAFDVELVNQKDAPTTVTLVCEIVDFDGNKTERRVVVAVPGSGRGGGRAQAQIPLGMDRLGYFDAVVTAIMEDGREIWREPTSFAILPPDTRQAGDESPFGVWWFVGTHGGCSRLDWMGPLLLRMGIRHCCPGPFSEEELEPYKLSYSMANWPKAKREALLANHSNIRFGMIFHEKAIPGTTAIPPELLGRPRPEMTPRGREVFDRYWKEAEEAATWYREKHPRMRLSFGNSPSGISLWFMREGWPREWVDCFAMEGVGAWHPPECQPRRGALQEVWFLSEMRRLYGYEDVPVSSGYEYIARCTQPGALTEREQGEFHVRDAIHALAYGYPSINIGLADDSADSYYSTIYAASGFLRRNPRLTPKPGYVMYATMTAMLDGAKYVRAVDTGSRGLYVLEFERPSGGLVYPVWTVRGRRDISFRVTGGSPSLTDSMGNTQSLVPTDGLVSVCAHTAPGYLVSDRPVVFAAAERPEYDERPPETSLPIDDFSDPSRWSIDSRRDIYLETYAADLLYTQGVFAVRAVVDEEKGHCTEVELQSQPGVPDLYARYLSLTLKSPMTLDREVSRIGMWVKGNSCWGRVFWEFEDADGERYFSTSDEGSGWDVSDWRGRSAINFDGWCFVSLAVPKRYPGGYHGPTDRDWSYDGDGVVRHPLTVRRVVVALRDRQVYVDRMVDSVGRAVRLSGLVAGE